MKPRYIDYSLKQYIDIKGTARGRVAEISSDVFTVLADGNLIYFVKDEQYLSPMSIVVEEPESFKVKGISINDDVTFESGRVVIGDKLEIAISNVEVINIKFEDFTGTGDECVLGRNLKVIEDCIYSNGKHEGIAPVVFEIGEYVGGYKNYLDIKIHNNLYTSLIFEKMIKFMDKMSSGEIDGIWNYSGEIVGLGPGITPSSNDFLCGLMNTLIYGGRFFGLSTPKVHRFNEELLLGLECKRDRISHYIMKSSIYGKTQKIVAEVVSGAFSLEDEEDYRSKLKALINFGDITGTDMLCGIYMGYRTLQSENFREKLV